MSVTITYDSATIANVASAGKTIRLTAGYKPMATDVVVVASGASGENVEVAYGTNIVFNQQSGTCTLKTAGKFMAADIIVDYTGGSPTYPVKGDVIGIDMNGDGTVERYTVLTITGSIAEVMARVPYGSTVNYGSSQTYEGSDADTLLNSTYYATLSVTAKAAIVDKTFRQDRWYLSSTGNPDYIGVYNTNSSYTVSVNNLNWGNEITRHVYLIAMKQLIDYFEVTPQMTAADTTLNRTTVQTLFNATSGNAWLGTAYTTNNGVFYATMSSGRIQSATPGVRTYSLYPTFQVDLSKISWTT